MIEQIICDRIWLEHYLNQLKQCESDMRLIKEHLNHARNFLAIEKQEMCLDILQKADKIESNFQIMHRIMEDFIYDTYLSASELKHFCNEKLSEDVHDSWL